MKKTIFVIASVVLLCTLFVSFELEPLLTRTIAHSGIDTAISHRMMDVIVPETGDWTVQQRIEQSDEVIAVTGKVMDQMLESVAERKDWEPVDLDEEMDQIILLVSGNQKENVKNMEQFSKDLSDSADKASSAINGMAETLCQWMNTFPAVCQLVKAARILFSGPFKIAVAVLCGLALFYLLKQGTRKQGLVYCSLALMISAVMILISVFPLAAVFSQFSNRFLGRTMMLDLTPVYFWIAVMAAVSVTCFLLGKKR